MEPKKNTTVAIVDKVFVTLKKTMDIKIAKVQKITKITDKATMEVAGDLAKELNVEIKNIATLHTSGKKPYWDICKQFDAKKNELSDPALKALDNIKKMMLVFQQAEDAKAEAERQKIEAERMKEEKVAQAKQDAINKMAMSLQDHVQDSLKAIHQAKSRSELKTIYDHKVVLFRNNIPNDFALLQDAAGDSVKVIVRVGQMKDNVLKNVKGAKELYETEIVKYLGESSIALEAIVAKVEEVKAEVQEESDVKQVGLISKEQAVTSGTKGISKRVSWEYDLSEWEQVPEDW